MSIYAETMAAYFKRKYLPLRYAAKILARDAGVSPRTADNWLQGLNAPSGKALVRLMAKCPELQDIINSLVIETRQLGAPDRNAVADLPT